MSSTVDQQAALTSPDDIALADRLRSGHQQIISELRKLIIGQDDIIEQTLISVFAGGNCLIIGVPGLAKTLLVHTIARVLDLKYSRIQFTPDLMPSDITGTDIIQDDAATGQRKMVFTPGPVFANIVLADEINRTPPKTQSAMLEAMQEHRVTVQGKTYELKEPFFVFATQNPIELEGTYPLPEAQLDRFMFQIVIEYLTEDQEIDVVRSTTSIQNPQFSHAVNGQDIIDFQRLVRRVPVSEAVTRYGECRTVFASDVATRTGLHQEVGELRRQRARRTVDDPRRQSAGAHARTLPRRLRRHPRAGRAGAAPPHPAQLPRAVGTSHDRPDHQSAHQGRPTAKERLVNGVNRLLLGARACCWVTLSAAPSRQQASPSDQHEHPATSLQFGGEAV